MAASVFTCLAAAEGNPKFCDALPEATRGACVEQSKFVRELKGVPKGSVKGVVLEKLCLQEGSKAECAIVREAVVAQKPALCDGLSATEGAWSRNGLCPALAASDPAKCSGAPEGDHRATCEALAADDPTRCPKAAKDCIDMVGNFAAIKKGGMGGRGVDPITAAVQQGRSACEPLLTELQGACTGGDAKATPPSQ